MSAPTKDEITSLFDAHAQGVSVSAEKARNFDDARTWVDPNGYRLSDRVWNGREANRAQINQILREGVANRQDSLTTAKQLEQFLNPDFAVTRDASGKIVKAESKGLMKSVRGRGGTGSHAARRLAVTEVSRAHAQEVGRVARETPFAIGQRWNLSPQHPRTDHCDDQATTNVGLGPGVYPVDRFPRMPDHPWCMCYTTVETESDDAKIIAALRQEFGLDDGPGLESLDRPMSSELPDVDVTEESLQERLDEARFLYATDEIDKAEFDRIRQEVFDARSAFRSRPRPATEALDGKDIKGTRAFQAEDDARELAHRVTDDARRAVDYYIDRGFTSVNRALRGAREMTPDVQRIVDLIDGVFDQTVGTNFGYDANVYRGVKFKTGEIPPWLRDPKVGDVLVDPAYLSTSSDRGVAREFIRHIGNDETAFELEIVVPRGDPAVYLHGFVDTREREILLPRNTRLVVRSVEQDGKVTRIAAEVVSEPVSAANEASINKRYTELKKRLDTGEIKRDEYLKELKALKDEAALKKGGKVVPKPAPSTLKSVVPKDKEGFEEMIETGFINRTLRDFKEVDRLAKAVKADEMSIDEAYKALLDSSDAFAARQKTLGDFLNRTPDPTRVLTTEEAIEMQQISKELFLQTASKAQKETLRIYGLAIDANKVNFTDINAFLRTGKTSRFGEEALTKVVADLDDVVKQLELKESIVVNRALVFPRGGVPSELLGGEAGSVFVEQGYMSTTIGQGPLDYFLGTTGPSSTAIEDLTQYKLTINVPAGTNYAVPDAVGIGGVGGNAGAEFTLPRGGRLRITRREIREFPNGQGHYVEVFADFEQTGLKAVKRIEPLPDPLPLPKPTPPVIEKPPMPDPGLSISKQYEIIKDQQAKGLITRQEYLERLDTLKQRKALGKAAPKPAPTPTPEPTPVPVKPTSVDPFVDKVRARIAQGIKTEADAREVGALVREEVQAQLKKISEDPKTLKRLKEIEDELEGRKPRLFELQSKRAEGIYGRGPRLSPAENFELDQIYKVNVTLMDERVALKSKLRADSSQIVRDTLSRIRSMGGTSSGVKFHPVGAADKAALNAVKDALDYIPTDWADSIAATFDKTGQKYGVSLVKRGQYSDQYKHISISGTNKAKRLQTAIHELGHAVEYNRPGITSMERQFFERRTRGEVTKALGAGYRADEVTKKDKFLHPYMGKEYTRVFEILTMGIEGLLSPGFDRYDLLTKDTDYADFILGLLGAL